MRVFKNKTRRFFPIFTSLLLIVVVLVLVFYFWFLKSQLFKERSSLFVQFTEKVAENVNAAAETYWDETMTCEDILYLQHITDEQTLQESLTHMETMIPSEGIIILAFNQDGRYYASDGNTGRLDSSENLSFTQYSAKKQSEICNLPHVSSASTYYLFVNLLDYPITMDRDTQITHISIAVDLASLQELFTTTGFQDNCYTYLINETGRRLYKNTYSEDFIDGYNILSAIEEFAQIIYGGTMDDLRTSISEQKTATYEIEYQNNRWLVSNAVIPAVNCNLLLFVPTDLVASETTVLLNGTLIVFIIVLIAFMALFAGIIRSSQITAKNERKLLEEKAQIAAIANQAKSDFLSYMSHDIRTPINGIMGMTDIALNNMDNHEKIRDCLGKISSSSHHLLSLVNDILDLSRIESGKTKETVAPMDLWQVLEHCITILDGQLATRNLQFVSDMGPFDHSNLIGDELHLRQIFINILSNAVKFTPDGGKVVFRAKELSSTEDLAQYQFEIEDTGIGMNQEFISQLWDPFAQENRNFIARCHGTGLGMAITKRFVDMLGGTISVKSELDHGSLFTVQMSFKINPDIPKEESAMDNTMTSVDGIKILLVEDNELNMEIAKEILVSAGALVTCAENGKEAVDLFVNTEPGSYDLILMDMMMPVMDGLEATRIIRESSHPDGAQIPIVAMTANAFDEDIRRTKEAGMTAHLSKPVNPVTLVKTLATLWK